MRIPLGFRHGVHPPDSKTLTAGLRIRRMPFPDEVVLPLRQHAGKPAVPLVRAGEHVERGDLIARADGFISAPVHASASGVVRSIELYPHPDGGRSEAIRIAVDRWSPQLPRLRMVPEWRTLEPSAIVTAVQNAGVVGLGGAAFPAHVKLSPPTDARLDLLLVNGAECEPYLTSDHRTMVEYPARVIEGVRVVLHALGLTRAVIAVEDNKVDAVAALRASVSDDLEVQVVALPAKYPQGAEKMLIRAITGREVPSGKLPAHVGVVVQNVGTVAAIAEVFETGLPLVERIVSVTGRGVRKPANLIVPVGVKTEDLLAFCGGLADDAREVVFGGPMMGASQPDLSVPVMKGTSGVVVLTDSDVRRAEPQPCIRCGRCLDACPVFLNPSDLGRLAQAGRYEDMQAEHIADCMLCGSCAYACPSAIPLVQLFALAKSALRRQPPKVA